MAKDLNCYILNPVVWVFVVFTIGFVFDLCIASYTPYQSMPGFSAFSYVLAYIAACWVWKNSREKKIYFPADLAFLCFWIVFPAYLYESKGMKGILLFVVFIFAYLLSFIVSLFATDWISSLGV